MTYDPQARRSTGRTTRAFQHAKNLAESGASVAFVCHRETFHQLDPRRTGAELPPGLSICGDDHFDWERWEFRGYQFEHIIVDHGLIQRKFRLMLQQLHMFDEEPSSP